VNDGVVLALDFGGTKIAAAAAGLDATCLAQHSVATDPGRPARWNLEQGVGLGRRVLEEAGAARPLAIGVCTFGVPRERSVLLAPAIEGWSELALAEELALAFGCGTVRIANDVKAAASAEARAGALVGIDPAVYLNLGTGLGVAIVCGGKVVSGAHGAAGEIGYHLRRPADIGLDAAGHPILEHVVSGMALSAAAEREVGLELSAAEIFAGEPHSAVLATVLERFVLELSFHVVNLAVTLDPARIAVGGGMARSWDRLAPPLRRALDAFVPFPPELVLGAFPYDAPLVGAINMALDDTRSDSPAFCCAHAASAAIADPVVTSVACVGASPVVHSQRGGQEVA
jgi:glucokinase